MIDPKQIPFMIQLLDDDSVQVQENVIKSLSSFGPILKDEVRRLPFNLNDEQKKIIKFILKPYQIIDLKQNWTNWFEIKPETKRLEKGLETLAQFLSEPDEKANLGFMLDALAEEARSRMSSNDVVGLGRFLFKEYFFEGNRDDYYNPQNSNLISVIRNKKGIPISLASLFILVSSRMGYEVEGCNFPGHFLTRIEVGGEKVFMDCYNGGKVIKEAELLHMIKRVKNDVDLIIRSKASPEMILRRFLGNLVRSYELIDDFDSSQLMINLVEELNNRIVSKSVSVGPAESVSEN